MKYTLLLAVLILAAGCKKNSSEPETPKNPVKAILLAPVQNEACTTGTIISPTQSTVQLKWSKADNTDTYEVTVKNLETGIVAAHQAGANTQIDLTLTRNTPYSWNVTSKSGASTTTAVSDTWKFYNAGPSSVFYTPFPADALVPAMGANVTAVAGKVNLSWTGSDADNDIASYDVYFGTTMTPPLLQASVVNAALTGATVTANTTYYWKIITKDSRGNTSDSGLYQFKVN